MIIETKSQTETMKLGEVLGSLLKDSSVILLSGDLGAGKTTFTKGIGKALDIKEVINSPTFTIMKNYFGKKTLNHLDFYRLEENSLDYDLLDYINGEGVSVIEWPFIRKDYLPDEYLEIKFTYKTKNKRLLEFNAQGHYYEKILGEIYEKLNN